jgi:ribosomal protein S18 acetylase RimI-like enzyme
MKNSINFQISHLKYREISELVNLSFNIWRKTYPGIISYAQIITMLNSRYSHQKIKDDMEKNKSFWLVAKKNCILGFCNYAPMSIASNELKIDKLYVNPINQRYGIASKLINTIIESNLKIKFLNLQVNRNNINALKFYKALGFKIHKKIDIKIEGGYYMNDYFLKLKI